MSRRPQPTFADYIVIALSPALIMLLVGSLVFFLIEVFYQGNYDARLSFIMAMFVMAAVLIARISIEESREYAMLFALPLAAVTIIATIRFVEFSGPLKSFSTFINIGLIAFIWWCADRLTWDSTVIDESKDASGEGLLQTAGLDESATTQSAAAAAAAARDKPQLTLWQRFLAYRRRSHSPGVWVIYFSLAALPIFGFGNWFVPADDLGTKRYVFKLLVVYVASALGLLLTTSFLTLRRYLRQRRLEMPLDMAGTWIGTGAAMIVALLLVCMMLPRRNAEYSITQLPMFAGSPTDLWTTEYAPGNDGPVKPEGDRPGDQQPEPESNGGENDSPQSDRKTDQPNSDQPQGQPSDKGQPSDSGTPKKSDPSGDGKPSDPGTPKKSDPTGDGKPSDPGTSKKSDPTGDGKKPSDPGTSKKSDPTGDGKPSDPDKPKKSDPTGEGKPSDPDKPKKSDPTGEGKPSDPDKPKKSDPSDPKSADNQPNAPQQPPKQTDPQPESKEKKKKTGTPTPPKPQQPPKAPPKPQPVSKLDPSKIVSALGGTIGQLLKLLYWVAAIAIIGFFVWKYWRQIRDAFLHFLKSLREFWDSLLGRKPVAQAEETPAVEVAPPPIAFAAFQDPFLTGMAQSRPPVEVIRYSFAAMEAWARELGCARGPEQTPHEFAQFVGAHQVAVARDVATLAEMYNRCAYSRDAGQRINIEPLRRLWQQMREPVAV